MSNEKPLLMIPIETKVREFDAKLLLALVAVRSGFDVVVGALWEMKPLVDLLDRGIFFDKSVAKTKQNWFEHCRKLGHKVVALDEEGLVYFDAQTYRQLRIHPGAMELTDTFFAWGQDQREVIAEEFADLSAKIQITGNPRFDLLRPELRSFYEEEVLTLNEQFGRVILLNTSFSFANSANEPDALRRTFSQYPINTEQPDFFDGWMEAQRKVMLSMEAVLPDIRDRFPDHTIIIRPHPSEELGFWRRFEADLPKTHVLREGNVVPWILAADVLVHWNCTTAIEATILGVPAIAYKTERFDTYEQPLPNACSFDAYSPEDLLDKITQAVNGQLSVSKSEIKGSDEVLHHHVISLSGPLAAERMVESLLTISRNLDRRRGSTELILRQAKKRWRRVLDLTDKSRKMRDPYVASKFPDTGVDELRHTIGRLARCLDYHESLEIEQVCRNCFSLSTVST